MKPQLKLDSIKRIYLDAYNDSRNHLHQKLPVHVELWDQFLNEIERKIYDDTRCLGLELYPYYPQDHFFIEFANPFKKIAVLIRYKNSSDEELLSKVSFLRKKHWDVFVVESKTVTYTAEELFRKSKSDDFLELYDLEHDAYFKFIKENSDRNSDCLLRYIKEIFFENFIEEE